MTKPNEPPSDDEICLAMHRAAKRIYPNGEDVSTPEDARAALTDEELAIMRETLVELMALRGESDLAQAREETKGELEAARKAVDAALAHLDKGGEDSRAFGLAEVNGGPEAIYQQGIIMSGASSRASAALREWRNGGIEWRTGSEWDDVDSDDAPPSPPSPSAPVAQPSALDRSFLCWGETNTIRDLLTHVTTSALKRFDAPLAAAWPTIVAALSELPFVPTTRADSPVAQPSEDVVERVAGSVEQAVGTYACPICTRDTPHEHRMAGRWIGVDFDGTLAIDADGRSDPYQLGTPIAPMVQRVRNWIGQGYDVRIFTARMNQFSVTAGVARDVERMREALRVWCRQHIGIALSCVNAKDGAMEVLWDDRAVRVVDGNPVIPSAPVVLPGPLERPTSEGWWLRIGPSDGEERWCPVVCHHSAFYESRTMSVSIRAHANVRWFGPVAIAGDK